MRQAKFAGAGGGHRKGMRFGQEQDDAIKGSAGAEADQTAPDDQLDTDTSATDGFSEEAIAELLYMIEEEKLAGDIYEAFYDLYGTKIFDNIAASEDKHFDALITQADALGIDTDQFVFAEAGTFENPELQEMYDTLLATGSESLTDALEVGLAIEEKDMVDIAAAMEDVEGTTLEGVYENLLTGSGYHLDAFAMMLA